jgi:site-specific recombinase XerD
VEALVKYLESRIDSFNYLDEEDYLFVSSKNTGKISSSLIDYIFKKTGEYSGVGSWITPHVARASMISHLLDKFPVQRLSKEVRHKNIKMTRLVLSITYTTLTTADNYKCMQLGLFQVISSDIKNIGCLLRKSNYL